MWSVLLSRHDRNTFLYRFITGDKKWIYFKNLKHRKLWVDPRQPLTYIKPFAINKKWLIRTMHWSRSNQNGLQDTKSDFAHTAKAIRNTISALGWKLLPRPPYSPDLAPSDYHLFSLISHALSMQHFNKYGDFKKNVEDWTTSKDVRLFRKDIYKMPGRWKKMCD